MQRFQTLDAKYVSAFVVIPFNQVTVSLNVQGTHKECLQIQMVIFLSSWGSWQTPDNWSAHHGLHHNNQTPAPVATHQQADWSWRRPHASRQCQSCLCLPEKNNAHDTLVMSCESLNFVDICTNQTMKLIILKGTISVLHLSCDVTNWQQHATYLNTRTHMTHAGTGTAEAWGVNRYGSYRKGWNCFYVSLFADWNC